MNKAGIYKLTAPNGKCYIGQSINLVKRLNKYKNLNCENQLHIYNALKKYGWDSFTVEILWGTDDLTNIYEVLNMLEVDFINLYDSMENGYNLQPGGYNYKMSEATKKKISAAAKGRKVSKETRKKLSEAGLGREFSEEHKNKLSEARHNYHKTEKGSKRLKGVNQLDLQGNFIKSWPSMRGVERELGIKASNISAVCKGKKGYNTAGGYKWELTKED